MAFRHGALPPPRGAEELTQIYAQARVQGGWLCCACAGLRHYYSVLSPSEELELVRHQSPHTGLGAALPVGTFARSAMVSVPTESPVEGDREAGLSQLVNL